MRRTLLFAASGAIAALLAIALMASLMRSYGVLHSLTRDPIPEISVLDEQSIPFMAFLLGVEAGSPVYRDAERQNREMLAKFNSFPAMTLLHVLPAALLAIAIPLQFSRRLRSRHLWWHRRAGRAIILIAIPVTATGLFFGIAMPYGGAIEASGIAVSGALFLWSITRAYRAIKQHDISTHREWMIRVFGLMLGVPMVRVVGIAFAVATLKGPEAWFGYSVWLGFLITGDAAECWIRYTRRAVIPPAPITLRPTAIRPTTDPGL